MSLDTVWTETKSRLLEPVFSTVEDTMAIEVPAKERKRKRKVPMNSPMKTGYSWRMLLSGSRVEVTADLWSSLECFLWWSSLIGRIVSCMYFAITKMFQDCQSFYFERTSSEFVERDVIVERDGFGYSTLLSCPNLYLFLSDHPWYFSMTLSTAHGKSACNLFFEPDSSSFPHFFKH